MLDEVIGGREIASARGVSSTGMSPMKSASLGAGRHRLSRRRYGEHLPQGYLRMVVALVAGRLFAELDRLLRTPLDAGEALFAFEIRFSFHSDCSFSIFTPGIFSKSRMLTVATV